MVGAGVGSCQKYTEADNCEGSASASLASVTLDPFLNCARRVSLAVNRQQAPSPGRGPGKAQAANRRR